jgi:hypothetical protein
VVDFLSPFIDLPSRQPGIRKARFWRLVVAFCARTGFVLGSFCTSSKSDVLYFQQLLGFVSTILCFPRSAIPSGHRRGPHLSR